jgi:hypothetical protein
MDLNSIRTDDAKVSEGVWVELDGETSVKLRYTDTHEFQRKLQERLKPFLTGFRIKGGNVQINDDRRDKVVLALLADEVLVDWKGLKDNGVEVPYSREKALEYLQVKAFRDAVENEAARLDNFRKEQREEDAKNSEPVSAGI